MARMCEMCPTKQSNMATVYCSADVSYLCVSCDEEVHSANRLARRHVRRSLTEHDATDGSSIHDDSDACVPDVSSGTSSKGTGVLTHASTNIINGGKVDNPSLNDVSVTFEDAADYDFFDTLGSRISPLMTGESDNLFVDGKLSKGFYADFSWDSVVSDAFEHIVPDVDDVAQKDIDGRAPMKKCPEPYVMQFAKQENADLDLDTDVCSEIIDDSSAPGESLASDDAFNLAIQGNEFDSTDDIMQTHESSMHATAFTGEMKEINDSQADMAEVGSNFTDDKSSGEITLEEQRKKRRMEALARFRTKRANRSFTKRVRYECRKQLADSRPRVKGRFVRKVEMALFRKYGAMYREHLHELEESNDNIFPTE